MVGITNERLEELLKAEQKLCALEGAGVDNWDGYDVAMDMIAEWDGEMTAEGEAN